MLDKFNPKENQNDHRILFEIISRKMQIGTPKPQNPMSESLKCCLKIMKTLTTVDSQAILVLLLMVTITGKLVFPVDVIYHSLRF